MPPGIPGGAMCVQRFDDSLNSAIHITYRISLRSSSMPEPRDPLLKVLTHYKSTQRCHEIQEFCVARRRSARFQAPHRRSSDPGGFTKGWEFCNSLMIPPLVHQRRPCYDFYFL